MDRVRAPTVCSLHGLTRRQGELLIAEKRQKEMIRVRRLFIPELVIRLHSLLYASRKWFPE